MNIAIVFLFLCTFSATWKCLPFHQFWRVRITGQSHDSHMTVIWQSHGSHMSHMYITWHSHGSGLVHQRTLIFNHCTDNFNSYLSFIGQVIHWLPWIQNFVRTFSNRENILSVIMSCLRSSPNFRMRRVGVCCSAVESMFDISSHCGFCGSKVQGN